MSEPERLETVTEYCTIGFFGSVQCPGCPGHDTERVTAEWRAWDAKRPKKAKRKQYVYKHPTEDQKCRASSMTTGKRCGHYADKADPDGLCSQHARMLTQAKAGEFHKQVARIQKFNESLLVDDRE